MIEINRLRYGLYLTGEDGWEHDISGAAEEIEWGEGEDELAGRLQFRVYNVRCDGVRLSSLARPGLLVRLTADWGGGGREVARGVINDWNMIRSGGKDTLSILAYDELFFLQQSADNRYIGEGTGTKAALTSIFNDWGIPVGLYSGPNKRHAKTLYKNCLLGDIVAELLDTSEKQGAEKCLVRASGGGVDVIPVGSNEDVYYFDEARAIETAQDRLNIERLVTRVKVVGTENRDGRQPVEAIVDGRTEFGIRQRIYTRGRNDSLAMAKAEAQAILDRDGTPKRTITVDAPDIPVVRRGDKVYVSSQTLTGYAAVKAVRHSASARRMTMELEPWEKKEAAAAGSEFQKGDTVVLNGAVYRDSYGNGKGMTFTGRVCTITIKVDVARPCPYHVDGIGWVYPGSIAKS